MARAGVQAGSSRVRKQARATAAGGVQGLRVGTCLDQAAGGRSRKFSQPPELVCGIFPGHASTCPTFHPGLFVIGQGASALSGYFRLNGGGVG